MGTRARVTTVAGAATLLCAASVFGAGTSIAAPAPAAAPAAPASLVGSCGETVKGAPGQPVGVRMAGLSVINLGEVPNSGSTTFDATSIVQDLLGSAGPVCKLTAEAIGPLTAPVEQLVGPTVGAVQGVVGGSLPVAGQQPAQEAPATGPAPAAPGALPQTAAAPMAPLAPAPVYGPTMPRFFPFALGRYQSGLPLYNYASLLVGRPGTLGRLSAGMLSPNLFGSTAASLGTQDAAANDVAAAGRASALPASDSDRIALPVLVAVLMLAGVTAALIRSWVLVTRVDRRKA